MTSTQSFLQQLVASRPPDVVARLRTAMGVAQPLPSFPVDALPPTLAAFVTAQAQFTQVPVDLPAMLAIGACAASVAGKVDLQIQADYYEPLNLFVAVGLPTGERKSPNFEACFGPLQQAERVAAETTAPVVARAKAARDVDEKKLARLKKELAEAGPVPVNHERSIPEIQKDIDATSDKLTNAKIAAVPRYLVDDCTVERLASLMGEHGGRMCVASDEGTILGIAGGRYSRDGRSAFEALLKGYSGTAIRIDRQSADRPPVFVRQPRLTICVTVQPSIIESMAKDTSMQSQGLLARFLYALPASKVGMREVDVKSVPADVRAKYEGVVYALATLPAPEDAIPRIRLSAEALALHQAFRKMLEPRLHPKTGDLVEIADWANKYPGQVARIAGVMHCAEHGPTGEVSAECMGRALRIGEYLLAHAQAAYGANGSSSVAKDEDSLLAWARRRGKAFSVRDARRLGPAALRNDAARLQEAIGGLVERQLLAAKMASGKPTTYLAM